jgi:signal transduction histidine kinase
MTIKLAMRETKIHFVSWLFLLSVFSTRAFTQYQVSHITTDNGLPSNGIKGLQWDKKTGFLWIATEAGLVRYNGMAFKTFDVNTNPEFGSNRIIKLEKNYAGRILAIGQGGNLSEIKDNSVSFYFDGSKLAKYNYNHYLAVAASDTLFKKTYSNKPWREDHDFYLTTIASINDTSCLILTDDRLWFYSLSTPQPVELRSIPHVCKNIFKINNQVYLLSEQNKLFSYDVVRSRLNEESIMDANGDPFVIENNNTKLFWRPGMELPVLITQGLGWLIEQGKDNKLYTRLIASGIPEDAFFNFVQYDKDNSYLFLGTASKGIYIIHPSELLTKQPAKRSLNVKNAFYSQLELPDGNIITGEGTVIGDAPAKNYNIGKFLNSVFSLGDSTVVYANKDSVVSYNWKTHIKKLLNPTNVGEHFCLAISEGHLYYADQQGIAVANKNGGFDLIQKFDRRSLSFTVIDMIEEMPGKLLIATCDELLFFDIQERRFQTLLKLNSVCIRGLYRQGDYFFISTYGGGYYIMKNRKLKPAPLDNDQYLKYTNCFMPDDSGFLWISSNNGLFKAKISDITEAYEKDLHQIYYHYFGKEDGMATTEMNGGCKPCAIRLKNGNFSFPTMDGLLWFNPLKVNVSLPKGNIYVDKILLNGLPISNTDHKISLPDKVKVLEIVFSANTWCKKENIYLEYKLNNEDWRRISFIDGEPQVKFTNLRSGKYEFLIRKLNGFGVNNYSYATLRFNIAKPFYDKTWFYGLLVLAAAALVYLIFRLRLRQYAINEQKLSKLVEQKTKDLKLKTERLEKSDIIKTRLISIINHDIITPLRFMHYSGEAVVNNEYHFTEEEKKETISQMAQTAKDMEMLSSQILHWISYQNPNDRMQKEFFNLHRKVEKIFEIVKFQAKRKKTKLQNDVPNYFLMLQYWEPMRVLLYNLVMNSLNFTQNGTIWVQSVKEGDHVCVVVRDTGLGMTKDQVENILSDKKIIASQNLDNKKGTGLGYLIIKDLLQIMGGTMSIESQKGQGTTVTIVLPND